METFCTMICLVETWMLLSRWVGESGMVTMDCSGEFERGL